jgi:hypothetical protein
MTLTDLATELQLEAPNLDALRRIASMTHDAYWIALLAESTARMRQLEEAYRYQYLKAKEGKHGLD